MVKDAVSGVDVVTGGQRLADQCVASWFARAYPVWTRIVRARAVAVAGPNAVD